jgi:hypothetical protein
MIIAKHMKRKNLSNITKVFLIIAVCCLFKISTAQNSQVTVDWNKVTGVSRTTPTLQVVVNPMLRTNAPMHDGSFHALKDLGADYVRYVPWFPYTRLAVAELYPPTNEKTYWDFTLIDSMTKDFMEATEGHSVVINFSTIPVWLFKSDRSVHFPDDPNEVFWDYNVGTVFRDTSLRELVGYYARLFSWYTRGGFTDELGKYHRSGHFYKIAYWEVLNEPDLEHNISPKEYTRIYDAVVTELKKISPSTKFVGISLAFSNEPEWFEYFLNKKNHHVGVPLDAISYHFYATPARGQTLDQYQYSFFDQATGFLNKVKYIERIRRRLSPNTITTINEIGSIIGATGDDIPVAYWNLSGAMYAYLFIEMTKQGIEVAGESQLVGYPTQFPDVSMMNWKNGKPNSRYWVLKLLKDHFGPGDKLVETNVAGGNGELITQGFITPKGKCLLLINQRNNELSVTIPTDFNHAEMTWVDQSTGEDHPKMERLTGNTLTLKPFAVVIVKL